MQEPRIKSTPHEPVGFTQIVIVMISIRALALRIIRIVQVYIQLNSEQEKASLSFKLSLKTFPHVRKLKIALTRPYIHE